MKISVYNQEGKESGQAVLPKDIFDLEINSDLLHQVVVSQMANQRKVIAKVKDRSEVSGGGRKPWRQKGTGRARHGSNRSPIWRHGGVTFGPTTEKVFKKIVPSKMKRNALLMALASKAQDKEIVVVEDLKIENAKTKEMANILNKLGLTDKSVLVVLAKKDDIIIRAARNIPGIKTIEVRNLNALIVLSFKYLLMTKEAIKTIKETFLKTSVSED